MYTPWSCVRVKFMRTELAGLLLKRDFLSGKQTDKFFSHVKWCLQAVF